MAGLGSDAPARATRATSSSMPPFAALPTAPGMVRAYVKSTLVAWGLGQFSEAAELIASELTSNAVEASTKILDVAWIPMIRVYMISNGDVLTIEVWDQGPGIPVLHEAGWSAETGRGLAIIDSLSGGACGCQPAIGRPGKCVWAELPLRGRPARPSLT